MFVNVIKKLLCGNKNSTQRIIPMDTHSKEKVIYLLWKLLAVPIPRNVLEIG